VLDYHALLPEFILAGTVVAVLVTDLVVTRKYWVAVVGMLGLFAAMVPLLTLGFCPDLDFCNGTTAARSMFDGSYVVDGYSLVLKGLFIGSAFLALLLSVGFIEADRYYQGEYYFLLLASALGAVFMASSRDFVTIIVALELVSGPAFLLAGWKKADERSNEAALKFFLIGVIALALLVFGVSMIYGLAGTQSFAALRVLSPDLVDTPLFTLGVIFILLGFGFKVSGVPFHYWTPDTYEGAPTPVTAWLSVGSKAAGFVGLLSVCYLAFPGAAELWGPVLWVVAAASMTWGNVVALRQSNVVRLLGYSSIAQAGFMLVPFGAAATAGGDDLSRAFAATVTYLLIYALMNLGAFGVVIAVAKKVGSVELADWAGMNRYAPGLAGLTAVFFFSLAGIPPLAGWFAKLVMFQAAINVGTGWGSSLAVIAAVNSVIALVYYAKVVRTAYFDQVPAAVDIADTRRVVTSPALVLALIVTAVAVLAAGAFPDLVGRLGTFSVELLATGL
jgi:NADH-quinone oxidoreductase subunit N